MVELSAGKSSGDGPRELPETSKVIAAEIGVVAGALDELDEDLSLDG